MSGLARACFVRFLIGAPHVAGGSDGTCFGCDQFASGGTLELYRSGRASWVQRARYFDVRIKHLHEQIVGMPMASGKPFRRSYTCTKSVLQFRGLTTKAPQRDVGDRLSAVADQKGEVAVPELYRFLMSDRTPVPVCAVLSV
jgi:hypothetical protein